MAIRDEGIDSARLDQIMAPFWSTLWGLAARGHWIRHDHQPVRTAETDEDPRRRITLPDALTRGDLTLSFVAAGSEFATQITFGATRRFDVLISRYPELVEFRAMVDGVRDQSWHGRYFSAAISTDGEAMYTLWLRQAQMHIKFSSREWQDLRDLFRDAWQRAELTDEEYAQLEALAGKQTMSEWVRGVLLKATTPSAESVLLAELLALRTILLNLHFAVCQGEPVTTETMRRLIDRADADKLQQAGERLGTADTRREP